MAIQVRSPAATNCSLGHRPHGITASSSQHKAQHTSPHSCIGCWLHYADGHQGHSLTTQGCSATSLLLASCSSRLPLASPRCSVLSCNDTSCSSCCTARSRQADCGQGHSRRCHATVWLRHQGMHACC
jgi:hypothetical protein